MKICSLLPSGTEILFALGLGDQVVGVTDLCDYPPEAKAKRVVSRSLVDPAHLSSAEVERRMQEALRAGASPFALDVEWLRAEKPDLILTQDLCYFCDIDASDVLDATASIQPRPRVQVLSPKTFPDIFETIRTVGEAAGAQANAARLTAQLQARVDAVASKAASAPYRPRVLSVEGLDPLVAGGHWLPEMKGLAGGIDGLFRPGCPAQRYGWETLSSYDPEALIVALCSSAITRSLRELSWLARQKGWWELPAVQAGEVYVIEHVYYSTPGPRVVKGLEVLAQVLHPELFTGMIPPDTVVKLDPLSARGCPPEEIARHFQPYP